MIIIYFTRQPIYNMFENHFKIAWRSIRKEKLFAIVKIGGLAVGIAACLLISLYMKDELSYDQHYTHKEQIYRVVLQAEIDGEMLKSTHFPLPFAETLESEFPEIQVAGKIYGSALPSGGRKSFRLKEDTQNSVEEGFLYGDQSIFEILEIALLEGKPGEVLNQPGTIVISASKAIRYFPDGNALGRTVVLDDNPSRLYTVTGIMRDFPENSHLDFDFLLPIEDTNMSWTSQNYFTYVRLDERSKAEDLEDKMGSIIEKYVIPAQIKRGRDESFINNLRKIEYSLQPIGDIHLKSDLAMADGLKHGDIRFVWLFGAIAIFILILAGINFINLTTAKSGSRAKEVGLRRTVGAFRGNLIVRYLTESVLYSVFAFIIGVLLSRGLLPMFNAMAGKSIVMPWFEWWFLPLLLSSAIIIGLLSGLYPAFYLSAFKPANVLKGNTSTGLKSAKLRSGLVIFQFSISIILMIGTLIIYQQMEYIVNKELGYDKEQLLILEGTEVLGNNIESFKAELAQLSSVKQVSQSNFLPIAGTRRNQTTFKKLGEGIDGRGVLSQTWRVDYNYVKTLGLHITEGRDFSQNFASDSINAVLINEKLARELGLDEAVGKQLSNYHKNWNVIGVVANFHFASLKEDIAPLALVIGSDLATVAVKISPGGVGETLTKIASIWDRLVPNQPISYSFLDQRYIRMHEGVQRMGKIFNSFTLLAVFVACLGLLALSAFVVEQRKKEISIRIVLGASFRGIYKILTLDFIKLILVSIVIAVPLGWYVMNRWLEEFAYRISIGWEIFATAAILAIAIALLSISYQSITAAITQPLKSLRTE